MPPPPPPYHNAITNLNFLHLTGLMIDFALVIQYSRLYNVNRKAEAIRRQRRSETEGLLANDELGNGVVEEEIVHEERHPETDNIKILLIATVIHLIGNIIATLVVDTFWPYVLWLFIIAIFGTNYILEICSYFSLTNTPPSPTYSFYFFQFTYGVTFPLYGFYIYRQPSVGYNDMVWVQTNVFKEILVGVSAALLAFGNVALAAVWTYGHQ